MRMGLGGAGAPGPLRLGRPLQPMLLYWTWWNNFRTSGPLTQFGLGLGAPIVALLSFPLKPIKAQYFPGGSSNLLVLRKNTRITSEPFRCPNITFQYIDIYLLTISRLLVMSVISSGTPNKLRSSNHITRNTNRHRTLSMRTLRFENNVDMTKTRLRSITNSGTWMPILVPTYVHCSLCHRYVTCPRFDRWYLNT